MKRIGMCVVLTAELMIGSRLTAQGGVPPDNFDRAVRIRFGPTTVIGGRPQSIALGDVNNDGVLDAIVGDAGLPGFSSESWYVLWGRGDGTFAPRSAESRPLSPGEVPGDGIAVAAGDIDGDGLADVVVSEYAAGYISVHFFDGTMTETRNRRFSVCLSPIGLSLGEANGDPGMDAYVACDDAAAFFVTTTGGVFQLGGIGRQRDVVAADVDRDGRSDAVFGLTGGSELRLVRAIARNSFSSPTNVSVGGGVSGVTALCAGQVFPATAGPDLAFTGRVSGTDQQFALPGIGTGVFGSRYGTGTAGPGPTHAVVADLNRDGLDELVVVDAGGPALRVIQAAASSSQFLPAVILNVSPSVPSDVAVGDLDHDGKPDIAMLDYGGRVLVYLNDTKFPSRRRAVRH